MMDLIEHSNMSSNVREYFQHLVNNKKKLTIQVADVASFTSKEFVLEKLNLAEQRWDDSYHNQNYYSSEHKDVELDDCRYSYNFWKKVADLKGCI